MTFLEEFKERIASFKDDTKRQARFPNISDKVMVAIGMRRTGKTYFLWQNIEILIKKNLPLNRILYLNFEDDRLYPVTQEKLQKLLDEFYSLYPDNHHQECYLFLDEIQNVERWPPVIRRYLDTKKVKIYLTGSSAKLLSKEIATSLRGRSYAIEIWPFSIIEFLEAKQISLPKTFGKSNLDKFIELLKNYLQQGGFPEITFISAFEQRTILQDYVAVVIARDIIDRHQVTNSAPLRYIIKFLLKNVGCSTSINKLYVDLKSQGFEVSKTKVHDYLQYLEDAFLTFLVPIYSESVRKIQSNPKKIYAVDTGLVRSYSLGFLQNIGHYFENLIYLDLRRARHQIYYYLTRDRQEVDFLTLDLAGQWHLFQVCWNIDDSKTFQREKSALNAAEKELNIVGKYITPQTYFTDFLPLISQS